jgi:IMP dehydrogenase
MSTYHISGVPITDENGRLVGILTNRDIRFVEAADYSLPVHEFMTGEEDLVTARVGISAKEAKDILQKHRIEKLPLVDENGMLKGLLTVKDIQKARDYPNASTDSKGRLLVGAAVGVGKDLETRVELMVKAGVDAVTIDTAHGHSKGVLEAVHESNAERSARLAGNVVTAEAPIFHPVSRCDQSGCGGTFVPRDFWRGHAASLRDFRMCASGKAIWNLCHCGWRH